MTDPSIPKAKGRAAKSRAEADVAGATGGISRRDFSNGVVLGTGLALLQMKAPLAAQSPAPKGLGKWWTGPGGIGDYARSNGNTGEVVTAAHSIRDGKWITLPPDLNDTGEEYDLVVVGGGLAGLMAAFTFSRDSGKKVLIIENHPVFGGESKQNEFLVDGYHLYAPQGANGVSWPPENVLGAPGARFHPVWKEIGLPPTSAGIEWLRHVPGDSTKRPYSTNSYDGMELAKEKTRLGYFYRDPTAPGGSRWVIDPWRTHFRGAPWPKEAKDELLRLEEFPPITRADWAQWLDSMTYKEFLQNVAGVRSAAVFDYIDPVVAVHGPGLGSDVISAYAASDYFMPGVASVRRANDPQERVATAGEFVSFPGGNALIARAFVRTLVPGSISGKGDLVDDLYGKINWSSLDRPGQPVRIRLRSTAIHVAHDGPADSAERVNVVYSVDGIPHRVRARSVVMASGQWVNKHVLRDIPDTLSAAMGTFHNAPILIANVAVRNWKYIDKLGISAARWFDGFGFFTNVRAPLVLNGQHMPFDPAKPTVLTFYVPFTSGFSQSGMSLRDQTVAGRVKLFSTSYADYERQIRDQLTLMFGNYGFVAERDIAAITLNRWGHALVVAQPGFFFGTGGHPAASDVIRAGYGRIRIGHSELTGRQGWAAACSEGERAAKQLMRL